MTQHIPIPKPKLNLPISPKFFFHFGPGGICVFFIIINTFLAYGQEAPVSETPPQSADDTTPAPPKVLSPEKTSRKISEIIKATVRKNQELPPEVIKASQDLQELVSQHDSKKRFDQNQQRLLAALQQNENEAKEQQLKQNQLIQRGYNLYLTNLKKNLPQKKRHANYTNYNRQFKPIRRQ